MAETHAEHSQRLSEDQVFHDLLHFAKEKIGQAMYDSLLRFKWAKYGYDEGCAAISFVLSGLIAVVNKDLDIDADDLALLIKERLVEMRNRKDDEDD